MANVFGILTTIVLLLSGFVAFKNQKAYEKEISDTHNEKGRLKTSQDRFQTAKDTLASTIDQREEVDADVVAKSEEKVKLEATNADLKSQIKSKTAKSSSNKEKLDVIRDQTAKIGNIKELAGKMKAMNAELEELNQTIVASEATLANLTAQNNSTDGEIKAMELKSKIMSSGKSLPTLNTRIRSIYPTWGFVTLGAGNSSGVVTYSLLDVVRDGSVIAKLMVTAVETNSSSASIVPDSIAKDVTLMIGDRVIPTQEADKAPKN